MNHACPDAIGGLMGSKDYTDVKHKEKVDLLARNDPAGRGERSGFIIKLPD